jgi:hypothetical protein
MNSSVLLSFVAVPSLALALGACGGKEATVDRSGSTEGAQTAGQGDPAKTAGGSNSGSNSGSTNNGSGTPTAPAPDCAYSHQSGSGGSGGPSGEYTCLTDHHFECVTGGERSVSCECTGKGGSWGPTGSCTCSDTGVTFTYDCSDACSPLPDEVFAKCNLPVPPLEPSGTPGGSTSSSSGGP